MEFNRFLVRSEDIASLEGVTVRSGQKRLKQLKAFLKLKKDQRPSLADYARWRGWCPREVMELAQKNATNKTR